MDKDLFLIPLLVVFWSWTVWFVLTTIRRYKTAKLQLELRNRMLDKLGSCQELLNYLQTDAGKQFLSPLIIEHRTPHRRIVGALEVSVVLAVFGIALLVLRGKIAGAEEGFLLFGTLILALGIGFALAATVSCFLSRRLGLLGSTGGTRGE